MENIQSIKSRLNRIQGQLAGIEPMINKKPATEVIQQLEAIKGAIGGVEKQLLLQCCKETKNSDLTKLVNYVLKQK